MKRLNKRQLFTLICIHFGYNVKVFNTELKLLKRKKLIVEINGCWETTDSGDEVLSTETSFINMCLGFGFLQEAHKLIHEVSKEELAELLVSESGFIRACAQDRMSELLNEKLEKG